MCVCVRVGVGVWVVGKWGRGPGRGGAGGYLLFNAVVLVLAARMQQDGQKGAAVILLA